MRKKKEEYIIFWTVMLMQMEKQPRNDPEFEGSHTTALGTKKEKMVDKKMNMFKFGMQQWHSWLNN
jgi:hypothetical protein